jgi:hypothetical protein
VRSALTHVSEAVQLFPEMGWGRVGTALAITSICGALSLASRCPPQGFFLIRSEGRGSIAFFVVRPASLGALHFSPRRGTQALVSKGFRLGAIQVGMPHALYEQGVTPDLVVATSVGAVNGAFIASRPPTIATARKRSVTSGEKSVVTRYSRRTS